MLHYIILYFFCCPDKRVNTLCNNGIVTEYFQMAMLWLRQLREDYTWLLYTLLASEFTRQLVANSKYTGHASYV